MPNKTFIIATTGDRFEGLCTLLKSLERYLKDGWHVGICMQKYSDENIDFIRKLLCGMNTDFNIFEHEEMIGAHPAKIEILDKMCSDVWCSLDDDMISIEHTNYDKIADILLSNNNIGFISGNWAKTIPQADKKILQDILVKQNLVYTGGGLLFRNDVANIIKKIPNRQYLFDDCLWALYAYINGYNNYRYMGSIAIHKICTVGGRRSWIKQQGDIRILPPSDLLQCRKCNDIEGYHICCDKDITEFAHYLHKENLKMKCVKEFLKDGV